MHPDVPYYVPAAIRRLEPLVDGTKRVFEWGSGASTIWYARRTMESVAVEDDDRWYRRGVERLRNEGLDRAKIIYCRSHEARPNVSLRKPQFEDYTQAIDAYPDRYFDLIAVDGRERVGCLKRGLHKLKEGGTIVLDDSSRPHYDEIFSILGDAHAESFRFGLMQTTIFTGCDARALN